MRRKIAFAAGAVLAVLAYSAADFARGASALQREAGARTFTGVITDAGCGTIRTHAPMQMGPTDAACTLACVDAHGDAFALLVGEKLFALSDQKSPAEFAGQKVKVVGTLDASTDTILVRSIARAP